MTNSKGVENATLPYAEKGNWVYLKNNTEYHSGGLKAKDLVT